MEDPRLDRIFMEAYHKTMGEVEKREWDKRRLDHISAYKELFEKDLLGRDLSSVERQKFLAEFERYITKSIHTEEERKKNRKTITLISVSSILGACFCGALIYCLVFRPFMPVSKVESNLAYYHEKVEDGYGEYSNRYYSLLRKHERKLGADQATLYRQRMYETLDEHFNTLLVKLENGEVVYFDDARRWAKLFPDREEQKARKQQASNAVTQGFGHTIGESVKTVTDGVKNLIDKALNAIQDNTKDE